MSEAMSGSKAKDDRQKYFHGYMGWDDWIWWFIIGGGGLLILILVMLCCCCIRRAKRKGREEAMQEVEERQRQMMAQQEENNRFVEAQQSRTPPANANGYNNNRYVNNNNNYAYGNQQRNGAVRGANGVRQTGQTSPAGGNGKPSVASAYYANNNNNAPANPPIPNDNYSRPYGRYSQQSQQPPAYSNATATRASYGGGYGQQTSQNANYGNYPPRNPNPRTSPSSATTAAVAIGAAGAVAAGVYGVDAYSKARRSNQSTQYSDAPSDDFDARGGDAPFAGMNSPTGTSTVASSVPSTMTLRDRIEALRTGEAGSDTSSTNAPSTHSAPSTSMAVAPADQLPPTAPTQFASRQPVVEEDPYKTAYSTLDEEAHGQEDSLPPIRRSTPPPHPFGTTATTAELGGRTSSSSSRGRRVLQNTTMTSVDSYASYGSYDSEISNLTMGQFEDAEDANVGHSPPPRNLQSRGRDDLDASTASRESVEF